MSITILSSSPNPKINSETRNPEFSSNSIRNAQKIAKLLKCVLIGQKIRENLNSEFQNWLLNPVNQEILGIVPDSGNKKLMDIFS